MKIEASTFIPLFPESKSSSSDKTSAKEKSAGSHDPARTSSVDTRAQQQDDFKKVQQLQTIQQTVFAHELDHKEAGPDVTGSVTYRYKRGPDGQMYAVGGDTSVNISFSGDPKQTIEKMDEVKKAATAPANPSFDDFVILAHAIAYKQQAIMMQAIRDSNESKSSKSTQQVSAYA